MTKTKSVTAEQDLSIDGLVDSRIKSKNLSFYGDEYVEARVVAVRMTKKGENTNIHGVICWNEHEEETVFIPNGEYIKINS